MVLELSQFIFFRGFQDPEASEESETRKIQNLHFFRFGWSKFDENWHVASFWDVLHNDARKKKILIFDAVSGF